MLLGIVVGILPGFSAQNTLIILLPLTLYMPIEAGMAFMISLYCTTQLGGGIPAILFNMPGEGGAAATTLDGYPMTKKGQAQQALVLCFAAPPSAVWSPPSPPWRYCRCWPRSGFISAASRWWL